ncbi:hypothetical protein BBK36DRAFT_1114447 [Trichoderma citrinoviride]|uniref:BRCT domain-containing protein n=1 Tax=Trichoderma citrinoviride TaxID=58853 RepID=A0A2T4BET9_9HYPO|nr:hypothetical protein BBK36DRAFT_1114447 [Trichoderma citrinoviride]PTB67857.1 hypothetical protein BBK36DRAFT_1114447 [Trichoderma citrinoviride]
MPRRIFKNLVIATAGPLPGQLTVENLRTWTALRKGVFTEDYDADQVTHLLCTREQFDQKLPRIKEALTRGAKKQHIVHCDWFEISAVNDKRQPEREYSMRNILAKQNAAKREQARIERGRREGERAVNTNLFHIYTDRTFFNYQIDITRDDIEAGHLGQRYTLYLWESNAKPHLYWFAAKFIKKKGDSQPSFHRPSPCSGPWRREMDLFMDFFRIKTGIEWQDRVIGQGTMSGSYFQYSPPTGGKPVGRRLRFCYEYCLEINAQLRGLPWPPLQEEAQVKDGDEATEAHDAIIEDHGSDGNGITAESDSGMSVQDKIDIDNVGKDVTVDGCEEEEQVALQESEEMQTTNVGFGCDHDLFSVTLKTS